MKKITKRIQERQQEKKRALYVRLPHTIKDEEDVAKLFTGNFKVNLLRQSRRYCYVIFPSRREKDKNWKAVKDIKIDGKRVVVGPAITKVEKKPPTIRKKIVIPKIKPDTKVTRHLFVSNIKCGTKRDELRAAIPGCLTIKMLEPYSEQSRAAIIKMESAQAAAEYLRKVREAPTVAGRKLRINPDTRNRRSKCTPFKIYDEHGKSIQGPEFKEN
ncbi:uncharacterized protein LOC108627224 [Ceratina calcarata]|uniref:Uncharacterized protein LOC108627224 n=1 Tax=Ceratina calcarata TaxID=156304 RepID=A0AAJ7J3U9_9HYME|nr:uncharacterized protein LOC108627224 [Ceratina calcarata]